MNNNLSPRAVGMAGLTVRPWWADAGGLMLATLMAAIVLTAGCRQTSRPRTSVSGSVWVAGKPVERGFVRFDPLDPAADSPMAGALVAIIKGRYVVETGGGLMPGDYRVAAAAERNTGRTQVVRTLQEEVELPERVVVTDPAYAGPSSPLRFTADGRRAATFDIDLPPAL